MQLRFGTTLPRRRGEPGNVCRLCSRRNYGPARAKQRHGQAHNRGCAHPDARGERREGKKLVAAGSDGAKRVGTLAGAPTRDPQNQTVVAAPTRDFVDGKALVAAPIKPAALAKEHASCTSGNYGYPHPGHSCENTDE
jgi:hypothetical protein